jgi:hypothetical protein
MFKRRKRHRHEWGKWLDAELEMVWWGGRKVPVIGQTRVCESCGRREFDY